MSSRVGYGKSGTFEVYSGYGNNTLSYFIGGVSGEYRNLKFLKPATGELKTWLEANAVKMPLTGTWVFNNTLTNAQFAFTGDFVSNGTNYTTINFSAGYFKYDQTQVYQHASTMDSGWSNQAYRTITFTQPVKYEGNEEFVRWFVDNAALPAMIKKGTYVFNDSPFADGMMWTKGASVTQNITAKSNNTDVSSINLLVGAEKSSNEGMESGLNIESISYNLNVGGMTKTTQVYNVHGWTSNDYKTIEIIEDCIVDEKFKKWFDYYTTKQ